MTRGMIEENHSLEIRKTPIAMGVATTAFIVYTLMTINALIFPSVADQLLSSFFQLSDTVHAEGVFAPQLETFVFGAAIATGGSYVFTWMSLAMAQTFANVGRRRALHVVPQR